MFVKFLDYYVDSLTQVISNGTFGNVDTMLNTKISCSSSKMINIISWLQELLPFVHQNMSFLTLLQYANFATAAASMSS